MTISSVLPSRLKAGVRRTVAGAYYHSGRFKARLRGRVIILMYHRVLTPKELAAHYVQPGMYVLADVFARQMQFLRENFHILSLEDLIERWQRGGGLDHAGRYCVVTFDDGWLDNYLYAYPVLRRLGIPATIFLPTRFIGTHDWFWPERLAHLLATSSTPVAKPGTAAWIDHVERTIEEWKDRPSSDIEAALREMNASLGGRIPTERVVVDWDEVAEMGKNGISFGSHSATHAILATATADAFDAEISESLAVLRRCATNPIAVFCYPNGAYTEAVVQHVKAAGYVGALTTDPGWETTSRPDLFRLRRIGIHNDISRTTPLFALQLCALHRLTTTGGG
jgi:peptidoglycan/xylan/chitin deacetylase (PgdA/CDA1 family)